MPPKKKAKKEIPKVQKVKITIPSDKQHWGRNLPEDHGELTVYNHFFFQILVSKCRTVKVTDTEPYYLRAVPATKAFILC